MRESHRPELSRALEEGVWSDGEPPPHALLRDGEVPQPDRVRIRAWAEVAAHYTVSDLYGGALSAHGVPDLTDTSQPANHIYDKVISARVDVNRFWDLKVEGHFIDGYANTGYPAGFYPLQNPSGFKTNTNAVVVRTGFHF